MNSTTEKKWDGKETQEAAKGKIVGNSIASSEEEEIASLLRERNLETVNANGRPVVPKDTLYTRKIKRILDLLVAVPVFVILIPFHVVYAICTYFDVGSPIIFQQTRCGKDGRPFNIIKFRNMRNTKDAQGNLLPAAERVTKFGKFVRKTSLDELLNLWSVIKGDMSIIGPRPLPIFYVDRMSERHKMRHAVRPGLECPRQKVEREDHISAYHYQFESDVWYVENVSFKTDVKLIFDLVGMVFSFGKRSKAAGVASYFVGYDDNGNATSLKKYQDQLSGQKS